MLVLPTPLSVGRDHVSDDVRFAALRFEVRFAGKHLHSV